LIVKRFIASLCIVSLLYGCNNQRVAAPTTDETTGGESDFAPLEESAIEALSLVETPTVTPNVSPDALGTRFAAGAVTTYSGRLLNDQALSYLFDESTSYERECGLAINRQRDLDAARLALDVGELRLQINSDRERFRIILGGRDTEIERLLTINEELVSDANEFPWDTVLVGVGSGALGLILGFVAGALYSP
jgi:hypothetical protein